MVLSADRHMVQVLRGSTTGSCIHWPELKHKARVTVGCWHLMMQTLMQQDPNKHPIPMHRHPNCLGALNILLDVFLFL